MVVSHRVPIDLSVQLTYVVPTPLLIAMRHNRRRAHTQCVVGPFHQPPIWRKRACGKLRCQRFVERLLRGLPRRRHVFDWHVDHRVPRAGLIEAEPRCPHLHDALGRGVQLLLAAVPCEVPVRWGEQDDACPEVIEVDACQVVGLRSSLIFFGPEASIHRTVCSPFVQWQCVESRQQLGSVRNAQSVHDARASVQCRRNVERHPQSWQRARQNLVLRGAAGGRRYRWALTAVHVVINQRAVTAEPCHKGKERLASHRVARDCERVFWAIADQRPH
eukprot:5414134-Prymnesium_polylepis.1